MKKFMILLAIPVLLAASQPKTEEGVDPPFNLNWGISRKAVEREAAEREWEITNADISGFKVTEEIAGMPAVVTFVFPPLNDHGLIATSIRWVLNPTEDSCENTINMVIGVFKEDWPTQSLDIKSPGEGLYGIDDMCMSLLWNKDAFWALLISSPVYKETHLPSMKFKNVSKTGAIMLNAQKGTGLEGFSVILEVFYSSDWGIVFIDEDRKRREAAKKDGLKEL